MSRNPTYTLLYNFLSKYHNCRDFNIKTRSFNTMYYQGRLVTKLPPNVRPTDMARAYAELELALSYVDYEQMKPIDKDFLAIIKYFQSRLNPCDRCTYHHVAGDNKRYEHFSSFSAVLVNAVDEAVCYFMD